MSAAKKTNLLDLQKTYNIGEVEPSALADIKKLVPLEFNTDKRGNLSSKYQETTVLIDNEHTGIIEPGEMWVVALKTGTSYYYAVPKYKVDEQFIATVLKEDHCQMFIDRIFDPKKGIKPRYEQSLKAVLDIISKETLERLAKAESAGRETRDRADKLEKQLKGTIEKNIALQKKYDEDVANLKEENKELKKNSASEAAKEDRRQLDAAQRECVDLRKTVSELEIKVKEAEGTNISLKKSYEESLAKADEDVKTANAQRDAVAEAKQKMADEYDAKIRNYESRIDDYEARVQELIDAGNTATKTAVKEQVSNLNEMIDQLQVDLANERANFDKLMYDYTALQAHSNQVEKQLEDLEESSKEAEKQSKKSMADQDTIKALQDERKILQGRVKALEEYINEQAQKKDTSSDSKKVQALETENQLLIKANDHLREEIAALTQQLQNVGCEVDFSSPDKDVKTWNKPAFRVKRVSKTALESDWFTAPRYNVLRSMTGNKLLIMPDEYGYVSCKDYTLEIAGLDKLAAFSKSKTLEVVQDPDSEEILVTL